jgi:hypothetical protein
MKKLALIFLLLLLSGKVQAVAYQSNGTGGGLWHVAASWAPAGVPGAADTVDIQPGDTITLDGNVTVGNNAANDTTYNINIQGNLVWPQTPGGNWTFSPSSSIRLQGVGKFYIGCSPGSPTDRLNCANHAIVEFQTGGGIKYDLRIDGADAQLIARGCEGFNTSSGTETRARIASCAPDCTAGVRTITLDRTVNWVTNPAITNPVTAAGTGNAEVILGTGGHESAIPLGNNHELAEVTACPATNQITLTLANAHQVGDMVVNPTRNILFKSSDVTKHGSIYATNANAFDPYTVTWVRLDEMGDGGTYNSAALGRDVAGLSDPLAIIDYTFITNCDDGGGSVRCWWLEGGWTTFKYNGAYNAGSGGRCFHFSNNSFDKTVEGITAIDCAEYGSYGVGSYQGMHYDKCWYSFAKQLLYGNILSIKDCLLHQSSVYLLNVANGYSFERRIPVDIRRNEFRNSTGETCIMFYALDLIFIDNDIDNCHCYGLYVIEVDPVDVYMETNTFDGCNRVNSGDRGALYIYARSGSVYSQGDIFGATTLNNEVNIRFNNPGPTMNEQSNKRFIFNETILNGPANPTWGYPMYSTSWNAPNAWHYRQYFGNEVFYTLHNANGVAGAHWGFGPGSMIIEHVTGAGPTGGWVDNTVNMKITPYACDHYHHIPFGVVQVESGDVFTVDLQIQKNQAIANGRRPRLMLKGCGFSPVVDYDEMADVNNTWDTVQVSGTANANGGVHLYLEVLNDIHVGYEPVDPPTIIIYVDGMIWSKI